MARAPDIDVLIGQMPTLGYASFASQIRTNDTILYAAGDVMGPSVSGTAALVFPNIAPPGGGEIRITSTLFRRDVAALIGAEAGYTLYLYSASPPSALADNVAWDLPAGDRAFYLGKLALGTPVDIGSTLVVAVNSINIQIALPGPNLYAYLTTDVGYTPVALTQSNITIHAVAL